MTGKGAFNDGRTTTDVEVVVDATDKGLELRNPGNGLLITLWAYGDIRSVRRLEPGKRPTKLRLACKSDPHARLNIDDAEQIARLQRSAPALAHKRRPLPRGLRWAAAATGVLVVLGFLHQVLLWEAQTLVGFVPSDWIGLLGQTMTTRLAMGLGGTCSRQAGTAALGLIASRLNGNDDRRNPLVLTVVDSPIANAFALPGNRLVVLKGLIQDNDSPDQLAAALALELAHAPPATALVLRRGGLPLALSLSLTRPRPLSIERVEALLDRPYTPEAEQAAGELAQQLLKRAEIPVQSLGIFFRQQALRTKQRGVPSAFLLDHPVFDAPAEGQTIQPFAHPVLTAPEWKALRAICD